MWSNLSSVITYTAPIGLYFIAYVFYNLAKGDHRKIKYCLKLSLTATIFIFLINAWALLPLMKSIMVYPQSLAGGESNISWLMWKSSNTSFLNLLRLHGHLQTFDKYSSNICLIGYVIVVFALSTLILKRNNKYAAFFSALFVSFIFLSKGTHEPFSDVFLFAFYNIPGFWVFRSTWDTFMPPVFISVAVLIAINVDAIYDKVSRSLKRRRATIVNVFISFILVAIIALYFHPFIYGDMLPSAKQNPTFPSQMNLDNYRLSEVSQFINQQDGDFRILLLPYRERAKYNGGPSTNAPILPYLIKKDFLSPLVAYPPTNPKIIQDKAASDIYDGKPDAAKMLGLLNAKYIIQRNDWDYNWYPGKDTPLFIKEQLRKQDGIVFVKSIGTFDVYENKYFAPRIYATDSYYVVENLNVMFERVRDKGLCATGEETVFWAATVEGGGTVGVPTISKDTTTVKTGNYSLKIEVGSGGASWSGVRHDYNTPQDWGSKNIIGLWLYGANSGAKFMVTIYGPSWNDARRWEVPDDFTGWKMAVCRLNDPEETWGSFNLSEVIGIRVLFGPNKRGTWYFNRTIVDMKEIFVPGEKVFFLEKQVDLDINEFVEASTAHKPIIAYHRINPTKYSVDVNATGPFFLVLSESYDVGWKAYLNGKQVPEKYHLQANGYANCWYVTKKGQYTLTLYYQPQTIFEIGIIITALTFIGLGIYAFWRKGGIMYQNLRKEW